MKKKNIDLNSIKSFITSKRTILFFSIFILIIIFYLFTTYGIKHDPFKYRAVRCIDYLEQGELYGGQPSCPQGPVYYWIGLFIKTLFGIDNLQLVSAILIILFHFVNIFLISNILN